MTERSFILRSEFIVRNLLAFIGKLDLSQPWEVIVRPWVEKRNNAQNNRLWALHTLAANHTGYSPEEMHEHALCRHFGFTERKVIDLFTGEVLTKRDPLKRSSQRNKLEFARFMEATEAWYIADFGVWLDQEPMPAPRLKVAA